MNRSTVIAITAASLASLVWLCSLALLLVPAASADDTVSIVDLINDMKRYNGRTVTIEGEAVGDVMVRGEYAWITVNDDPFSKRSVEEGGKLVGMSNAGIGVWLPASDARRIKTAGGYKNKGDTVRVEGVFNRACPKHGGDTDMHAVSLEVVKPGHLFEHRLSWARLLALAALFVLIAALAYWRSVTRIKWEKEE